MHDIKRVTPANASITGRRWIGQDQQTLRVLLWFESCEGSYSVCLSSLMDHERKLRVLLWF